MRLAWVLGLAVVLGGCGARQPGLKLTLLEASVKRPSNIALYFTVDTDKGEPVPGLTSESFQILEGGQPVSVRESKQTILNPEVAAEHFTLLLIDMSGSVRESEDVPTILAAARAFTQRIEQYQKIAVYAFDGSPRLHPLAEFSSGAALAEGIEKLSTFLPRDPSTNLNGAVLEGLKVLRARVDGSRAPLAFGTLVVFTDGTDRAHRVPREELHRVLAGSDLMVMVIGVGVEVDPGELGAIGRNGVIISRDSKEIASSFEAAAARVEAMSKRYYLLGYCSPARAGDHDLQVVATVGEKSGHLTYRFSAAGFGPNCDPTRKPSFNMRRPGKPQAEPPPAEEPPTGGSHF